MGKVLSLFRKAPSSEEKLTKLDEQIRDLEGYTLSTRETQRKFAGRFLVASIGTYVVAFIIFYFYFFPPTWRDRLIYSLPLLLFPVLIILLKYCVSWYFNSKIDRNNRRLINLRHEKRQVLQNVMDKETYKVALEILNTFGDKSMRLKASQDLDSSAALNATQMNSSLVQQRTPIRNAPINRMAAMNTPSAPMPTALVNRGTPAPIGFRPAFQHSQSMTPQVVNRQQQNVGTPGIPPLQFNTQKTPFPVIDTRKQNVMEKMMDFIISDGPSNRFAMICVSCCGHNGMALQEDFEYVAFKCAFCATLNPARKMRPKARGLSPERRANPMLMVKNGGKGMQVDTSSSSEDDDKESAVKVPAIIQTQHAREINLESDSDSEEEKEVIKESKDQPPPVEEMEVEDEENNNEDMQPKDLEEKKKD